MKVEIQIEKRYKFIINGESYCGFEKVSEWEGMMLFKNDQGSIIIDVSFMNGIVEKIMGRFLTNESESFEVNIVKASPFFCARIKENPDPN